MPSLGLVVPPDLPADRFLPYVDAAEAHGFDELWVVEDCFLNGGVAQAAVALAATRRITVGIGILPAAARNVAFASMDIATLARLFPGRLAVGIGHGMPRWLRQVGAWPASPLTLLEEYLPVLRDILGGHRTSFDGRYVHLDDVQLAAPLPVPPPLFAGVRGPRSVAAAGRIADGILLAEPVTPEYLRAVRSQLGPVPAHFQIAGYSIAAVDTDGRAAKHTARSAMEAIGDPDWAPHIAPLPFADEFTRLSASATSRREFAAGLPDTWVERLALAGTPTEVRSRIGELAEAGMDRVILIPAGPDPIAAITSLATLL